MEEKDRDYPTLLLLNDLDNGEDVSDEEIKKVFPKREPKYDSNGGLLQTGTLGLPKEYQAKLDAIRAKKAKEKDLKATPPEKK